MEGTEELVSARYCSRCMINCWLQGEIYLSFIKASGSGHNCSLFPFSFSSRLGSSYRFQLGWLPENRIDRRQDILHTRFLSFNEYSKGTLFHYRPPAHLSPFFPAQKRVDRSPFTVRLHGLKAHICLYSYLENINLCSPALSAFRQSPVIGKSVS